MSFAYSPIFLSGAGGGGGSSSSFGQEKITIGNADSGADYPTINAAIAAGYNIMNVISNVNEPSSIVVPSSGLSITIDPGATVNMGSNYFNIGDSSLSINGNGTILYAYSSGITLFDADTNGKLSVGTVTIDNDSPIPVCLTDATYARFYDVVFDGNVSICGDSNIYKGCIYKNSTIFIYPNVDNTILSGSIFQGVAVSDSGINTVIADSVVY